MKIREGLEICGNGLMYILTITQTKEVFQIVSLVLSILISVIILFTKIYDWWKKAKADGKISKEEIDELVEITKKETEDIVDAISEQEKEK